ncbi:hypothetical protein RIF29_19600 [Crotalaria pallida]|uniref:F-box domain-containing protein n=1 Tax=Crotalaria pallida TaxID=3830 RepID=A0AAN9F3U7_CROPI
MSSRSELVASKAEKELVYEEGMLIPSLPNDVALNCLKRVPRSKHPALSFVSKPIRSILRSPHFINLHSSSTTTTEPIFYATFFYRKSNACLWFMLSRNPFNSFNSEVLAPIPIPHIPSPTTNFKFASFLVVGTIIYVIGVTKFDNKPSPEVWMLECCVNTWARGPDLLVGRERVVANVLDDGKICVICGAWSSRIQAEVLDPKVGEWVEFVFPFKLEKEFWESNWKSIRNCAFIDNELYIPVVDEEDESVVTFDPRNGLWGKLRFGIIHNWDAGEEKWKILTYVDDNESLFIGKDESPASVALTGANGNLLLLRGKKRPEKDLDIWCNEIEVMENKDGELRGRIIFSRKTLSIPRTFRVHECFPVFF